MILKNKNEDRTIEKVGEERGLQASDMTVQIASDMEPGAGVNEIRIPAL